MSDYESHSPSVHQSQYREGFSSLLKVAWILALLLLLVVAALLLGRSDSATETEDAERAAVRSKNLAELQAADTALLNSYGWNDQAKGIVHLPIRRAMELVIPSLNARAGAGSGVSTGQQQP